MSDNRKHLSEMATRWSLVRAAQAGVAPGANPPPQWQLLERYGGAVQRYLLGAVGEPELAYDLAQDFAVHFLKGAIKGADPTKGRFRDYLKGVLRNLIANHFRRVQRGPALLGDNLPEPGVEDAPGEEEDLVFMACWREELLARAWQALEQFETDTAQPYYTVLRHRADHPDENSEVMAGKLSVQLGKAITPAGMRKALQRAREKFAEFLLDDLAASLGQPTPDELKQELIDVELYEYCRPALERRK